MHSPDFWWQPARAWPRRLLAPAGIIYGAVTARRMARPGHRPQRPTICIGNFVAGGAGKTPTVLWLIDRLVERGEQPAVLSRGYGRRPGRRDEVIGVEPDRHTAIEVGDEPLLLARRAPCFVAADRRRAADVAIEAGATILLLDDGLQNPNLAKSAAIAVVDGATGIGNGACLPAGPLRAPLDPQWPFVSLLLLLGDGAAGDAVATEAVRHGVMVVRGRLRPDLTQVQALRGRRLLAFAGIGRPEKFFDTLATEGLDVIDRRRFADHHAFAASDLSALLARARELRAELVTTEKDQVRLPRDFSTLVLPVELDIADPWPLDALLDHVLKPGP